MQKKSRMDWGRSKAKIMTLIMRRGSSKQDKDAIFLDSDRRDP